MIAVYNLLNGKYDFLTFSTTPEAICLSYLNHFQELMPGDIFLQEEWLSHGTIYPRKYIVCAKSEEDFKKLIDSNSVNIMYSVCN